MSAFLPYGRQTVDQSDVAVVAEALLDPMITQGPRIDSFERAVADYVHAAHAVAFANGTAALHAAAAAAGLGPGDEMLTTPMSFVASANCALFVGARPVFSDIDPVTANLDLAGAVRRGLPAGTKACVAVSMAGLPIDLEPIQDARAAGMIVIEDACHALGGVRGDRPVGGDGLADMYVFSFHPVKALTTGEGGMVTTDSAELADALRTFRTHGIRRREYEGDVLRGGWHYDIDTLGFNYRITDFQCALGEHQLARVDEFISARNEVAHRYRQLLAGVEGIALPAEPGAGGRHAYHLFVVRFPEGAQRRKLVYDQLRQEAIGTQLHYIPIPSHNLYRSLGYSMDDLPEAGSYHEQALSLPMFPTMTADDVDRVVDALHRALAVPLP